MTEKEQKQLENHFESALNDLVSGIKDTTATEVVMREQQMILFYKRVMLEIEKRDNLISKLQADIEIKDKVIERTCKYINEAKIMNKAIPVYPNRKDTPYTVGVASIEEIKQYFYKKVEEENE